VTHLVLHQRIETSGARTALPFHVDNELWLGVAQLAIDIPGTPAHMNGGDNDVDALLFRWEDGRFERRGSLPAHGGEDIEVFSIGSDDFLAIANLRSGSDPYEPNIASAVYRREAGRWMPFQTFDTFAAKQWRHFSVGGRHFLALAQGLTLPHLVATNPRQSRIFEWRDRRFEPFQTLDGMWGYNFTPFVCESGFYLAYADHAGDSTVYRWTGDRFAPHQTIAGHGGRAFCHFRRDDADWLAFATIDGPSILYRWHEGKFIAQQELGGPGGREFAAIDTGHAFYLARICFIHGTPHDPQPELSSQLLRWSGGKFDTVEEFPTHGGTDAHAFKIDGDWFLAVSNSLAPDVRFRTDTIVYRLIL
jgi:hypothetical protein